MTATAAPRAEQPDRPATGIYTLDPVRTFVLFSARHLPSTAVRRSDYGMKRDLITEIGTSLSPDVLIAIDAESTRSEID
jgi:polyisoprenoid-binding protein YceI